MTMHTIGLDTELALEAILALLVADRPRHGHHGGDSTASILTHAGLSHDQIVSLLGHADRPLERLQRPQSVIDRARDALTRGRSAS